MNLDTFIKKNKKIKFLNFTIDRKFAIIFDESEILLFKRNNGNSKKKNFVLDIKVKENDKFKKWNIINQKIINEKSSPNLLYLTSQIIS
tara:strand:+ start:96 stop:362 length:267 start_codon:yes stop_codon:yes gene_type:complete